MRRPPLLGLGLALLPTLACSGCGKDRDGKGAGPVASTSPVAAADVDAGRERVLDLVARFDDCAVGHHGPFVDLGGAQARALLATGLANVGGDAFEREGATWFRPRERTLEIPIFSPEEIRASDGVTFEARMRGGLSKHVAVHLNGKALGSAQLPRGESRTFSLRAHDVGLAAGTNTLSLRFAAGSKTSADVIAEIDWLRLGPVEPDAAYAAPTRADVVTQSSVGGASRPTLSLRERSYVRCPALLPRASRLDLDLALSGKGEADVEVRLLVDRRDPVRLREVRLGPPDAVAWRSLTIALPEVEAVAAIEVVVHAAPKGARVFVGAPRVTAPPPAAAEPLPTPARNAILIAVGRLPRRALALHGGPRALPEVDRLAARGLVFDDCRATSPLASAALASMLTGLPPRAHGVSDTTSMLLRSAVTVQDAARQAGITTAMFTANPETYAAFGFSRGFDTFGTHVPLEEAPATKIFDLGSRFIEAHKQDRFLLVLHARGAHPPWEATAEELVALPPTSYNGGLEPRQAGELLGKAQLSPPRWPLAEPDRVRALALAGLALAAHDAALGRLLATLRATGKLDDTAIFLAGDVGADESHRVPYGPAESFDEAGLGVPLIVVSPGSKAGMRVATPVESTDVARTLLTSLGLSAPGSFRGRDLFAPSSRREPVRIATMGIRVSARLGAFVLSAAGEREPRLCSLALDPACGTDVRVTHPIAAGHVHLLLLDELARDRGAPSEPAAQDPLTNASLRAWGRQM